jgi:hypothetical protein
VREPTKISLWHLLLGISGTSPDRLGGITKRRKINRRVDRGLRFQTTINHEELFYCVANEKDSDLLAQYKSNQMSRRTSEARNPIHSSAGVPHLISGKSVWRDIAPSTQSEMRFVRPLGFVIGDAGFIPLFVQFTHQIIELLLALVYSDPQLRRREDREVKSNRSPRPVKITEMRRTSLGLDHLGNTSAPYSSISNGSTRAATSVMI